MGNSTSITKSGTVAHLAGADGVRSIACLWVMLAHLFMELPPTFEVTMFPFWIIYRGGVGVGMFFVLSGFLLSQPFWRAFLEAKAMPSLRVYWARRMARIAPGYWLCVIVTALASGAVASRWDVVALLMTLSFTNCFLASTYSPAFNLPLWSISVEVWFYVFLPLTMMLVFRCRKVAVAVALIAVLMIGLMVAQWTFLRVGPSIEAAVNDRALFSMSESAWSTHQNPPVLFTHFLFGVLAGLALQLIERSGFAPRRDKANWCDVGAVVALVLLAAIAMASGPIIPAVAFMRYHWPFFPLIVGLLLVVLPYSRFVGTAMDNRFFRVTALLSFGLYMWHVPIFHWFGKHFPLAAEDSVSTGLAFSFGAIALTYLVAALSYFLLERPVLQWTKRREQAAAAAAKASP